MKKLLVLGTMAAALFVADADAFTKAGKAKNDQYQRNAIGIQDDNADEAFAQPIQDACIKLNALAKGLNVNKMYPASKYSKEDIKLAKDSKTKLTRATNSMKTLATIFTANKNGVATEFVPKNQLSLFDCNYQVTLFDIIEKEEKKKAKSSKKAEE
jgi:hypothetical protein